MIRGFITGMALVLIVGAYSTAWSAQKCTQEDVIEHLAVIIDYPEDIPVPKRRPKIN